MFIIMLMCYYVLQSCIQLRGQLLQWVTVTLWNGSVVDGLDFVNKNMYHLNHSCSSPLYSHFILSLILLYKLMEIYTQILGKVCGHCKGLNPLPGPKSRCIWLYTSDSLCLYFIVLCILMYLASLKLEFMLHNNNR